MEQLTADDMVLTKWDSVEYLEDQEDIKNYFEAALEEAPDDKKYINRVLSNIVRAQNILDISRKTGIARETIYKITRGEGNPTLSTISKIVDALGLRITLASKEQTPTKKVANGQKDYFI